MDVILKKILPYIITTLLVMIFWKIETWVDNYAFNPQGKDMLMLDIALSSIFFYKSIFWSILTNLIVLSILKLRQKRFIFAGTTATTILVLYFIIGHYINKKCAFYYFSVFINQSTMEEQLIKPILETGYQIGPILTENISDKNMKYRLYAINGLKKLNYIPAIPTLSNILYNKSEEEVYRANAYEILTAFDTEETQKIITNFKLHASNSLDKEVIKLGEYFLKNNQ